jgi:hypothetical protein
MSQKRSGRILQLALVVGVFAFAPTALMPVCRGGFVGDATGMTQASDSDSMCRWISTLTPVPAVLETGQDPIVNAAVLHALAAGQFDQAHGWTVNVHALQGSFDLNTYYAWVTDQPTVVCGGVVSQGGDHGHIGGAAFALGFTPKGSDPTNGSVHWMQVIRTDAPGVGGFDEGNGFHDLLDNMGSGTDPTYDGNGGAANAFCLVDVPHDICPPGCPPYDATWQFTTFIVTDDLTNHSLDIYTTGVEWGYEFECIPKSTALPLPSVAWAGMALLAGVSVRAMIRPNRRAASTSEQIA